MVGHSGLRRYRRPNDAGRPIGGLILGRPLRLWRLGRVGGSRFSGCGCGRSRISWSCGCRCRNRDRRDCIRQGGAIGRVCCTGRGDRGSIVRRRVVRRINTNRIVLIGSTKRGRRLLPRIAGSPLDHVPRGTGHDGHRQQDRRQDGEQAQSPSTLRPARRSGGRRQVGAGVGVGLNRTGGR